MLRNGKKKHGEDCGTERENMNIEKQLKKKARKR